MELKITNIQNLSFHDGPGIRTVIFLSGCPLRCTWCHNPETHSTSPCLSFDSSRCIGCRACEDICKENAHLFDTGHTLRRDRCRVCSECANVCPSGALEVLPKALSLSDFTRLAEKQKRVMPDGGITFSGGEPLMQAQTILSFLEGVDVHTAIETSGYADEETFKKVVLRMDYVMLDLKIADPHLHKHYTGVSNGQILRNLEILRKSGTPYVIRTPLIPGITDTEENLSALEKITGDDPWEKLPYNPLTPAKYERIGKELNLLSEK